MPEWVTVTVLLASLLTILITIIVVSILFSGLYSEAKRNKIPKWRFLYLIGILLIALIFIFKTITMQEGFEDKAVLVSPLVLAFTLVALQDFFNLQNSKRIEMIHNALKPDEKEILKLIFDQNEQLITELDSLKKENSNTLKGILEQNKKLIDEMNTLKSYIVESKTINIEDRRSLINFSPKFSKEK